MRFVAQRMAELAKPSSSPRFKPVPELWNKHAITAAWLAPASVQTTFTRVNLLTRGGKKIIFGGDTALCDGFKEIRGKGPFEFACMPIGAYNPYINSHCNPEQALQMTNDCGAKYILPMHHYTFRFGRELSHEP